MLAHFRGNVDAKEYPGVVKRVHNNGAIDVAYDDGDFDKALPASVVRPANQGKTSPRRARTQSREPDSSSADDTTGNVSLAKGDRVLCRFRGKGDEYPGTITHVYTRTGSIDVAYDDGDKDIRIPISAARPLEQRAKPRSGRSPRQHDGIEEEVLSEETRAPKSRSPRRSRTTSSSRGRWKVGTPVLARFRGKPNAKEYPGKIAKVHGDGTLDIHYDDGDVDQHMDPQFVTMRTSSDVSQSEEEEEGEDSNNEENQNRHNHANSGEKDKPCKLVERLAQAILQSETFTPGAQVIVMQAGQSRSGGRRRSQSGVIDGVDKRGNSLTVTLEDGTTLNNVPTSDVQLDNASAVSWQRLRTLLKNSCEDDRGSTLPRTGLVAALSDALNMRISKRESLQAVECFPSSDRNSKDSINLRGFLAAIKNALDDLKRATEHTGRGDDRSEESEVTPPASPALRYALSALILQGTDQSKTLKKLLGKRFTISEFRDILESIGAKKSLINAAGLAWIHQGLDVRGDGTVSGEDFLYFASCMNVRVNQSSYEALDRARTRLQAKNGTEKILRNLYKEFERADSNNSQSLDIKAARAILLTAGIEKRDVEGILKIDFTTAKDVLSKAQKKRGKGGQSSEEDSDDSSGSDDATGTAQLNKTNTLRGSKMSINNWRLMKRSGPSTFDYNPFIGAMAVPGMSETQLQATIQPIFKTPNSSEWLSKLAKKKVLPEATCIEQLTNRFGLICTPEVLSRCAYHAKALQAKSQDGSQIDTGILRKWLVKMDVCTAKSGRVKKSVLAHYRKYLGNDAKKINALLQKYRKNGQGKDEDETKNSDSESDSDAGRSSPKAWLARAEFMKMVETEKPKMMKEPALVRGGLELFGIGPEGSVDVRSLTRALSSGDSGEESDVSDDGDKKSEEDATSSEGDSESSEDSGSDSDTQGSSKGEVFLATQARKHILKATQKKLPKGSKDPAKALAKALRSRGLVENEESDPEGLRKFLSGELELDDKIVDVLEFSFEKNIVGFISFVDGLMTPNIPKPSSTSAGALTKLRLAALSQEQAALAGKHYGLLNSDKPLKTRVRQLLKAKAPKLATKDRIQALLEEASDEDSLIQMLAKKYRIKIPPNLRLELEKQDSAKSGNVNAKKAITIASKLFSAKLDKSQIEACSAHFAQGENLSLRALVACIQPKISRGELLQKLATANNLALDFAQKSLFDLVTEQLGGKAKAAEEAKFVYALYSLGTCLTVEDIYAIASALSGKTSDGRVRLMGLIKLISVGSKMTKSSNGDSDQSSNDEDSDKDGSGSETSESGSSSDSDNGSKSDEDSSSGSDEDDKKSNKGTGSRWFSSIRNKSRELLKRSADAGRDDAQSDSEGESSKSGNDSEGESDEESIDDSEEERATSPRRRGIKSLMSKEFQQRLLAIEPKTRQTIMQHLQKASKTNEGKVPAKLLLKELSLKAEKLSKEDLALIKAMFTYDSGGDVYLDDAALVLQSIPTKGQRRVLSKFVEEFHQLESKKQTMLLRDLQQKGKTRTMKHGRFIKLLKTHGFKTIGSKKSLEACLKIVQSPASLGTVDTIYFAKIMMGSCDHQRLALKLRHSCTLLQDLRGVDLRAICKSRRNDKMKLDDFIDFIGLLGIPLAENELRCFTNESQSSRTSAKDGESDGEDAEDDEEDGKGFPYYTLHLLGEFAKGKGKFHGKNRQGKQGVTNEPAFSESEESASSNESENEDSSDDGDSSEEDGEKKKRRNRQRSKSGTSKTSQRKNRRKSNMGSDSEDSEDDSDESDGSHDSEDNSSFSGESSGSSSGSESRSGKSSAYSSKGSSESDDELASIGYSESESSRSSGDESWGSSRHRRASRSRSRSRSQSTIRRATKAKMDQRFKRALEHSLRRAFEVLDDENNRALDPRELGRAMLAMGRECSELEIRQTGQDLGFEGKLTKHSFVKMGVALVHAQAGKLSSQREQEMRNVMERMDQTASGTLSIREFLRALYILYKEGMTKEEAKLIVKLADIDRDGTIQYARFIAMLKLGTWSSFDKKVCAATLKLIQGPVYDPSAYLKKYVRTPSNYRPPVMQELDKTETNATASVLVEPLARDSRVTEARAMAKARISESTQTLQVQLRVARGIPVIADEKLAQRVLERRARVCLWRKPMSLSTEKQEGGNADSSDDEDNANSSGEEGDDIFALKKDLQKIPDTHLKYAGNPHVLKANWDRSEEDKWYFVHTRPTIGAGALDELLVRIPEGLTDLCQLRDETLVLLVELSVMLETGPDERAPPIEMSCGWCVFEIPDLDRASYDGHELRSRVMGGSPLNPFDIAKDDILARRHGWRALRRSLSSVETVPEIRLRCQNMHRASRYRKNALRLLPAPFITPRAALPLLKIYMQLRAALEATRDENRHLTALSTSKRDKQYAKARADGDAVKFAPVLRIFPQILQDPDLLALIAKRWYALSTSSRRGRKRKHAAFQRTVLSIWPMLCAVERKGDANLMSPTARKTRKMVKPTADFFFSSIPSASAVHNGKTSTSTTTRDDASTLLFRPFNIREATI